MKQFLLTLVSNIGWLVVRIYLRISELFKSKKEVIMTKKNKPVGDHFPVQREYPVQFPMGEITQVISYFRNDGTVDMACAAICGWNVQGFAQSMILPAHVHASATSLGSADTTEAKALSDADLANKLEECCALAEDNKTEAYSAEVGVPAWLAPFIPLMLELASRLLDRFLNR